MIVLVLLLICHWAADYTHLSMPFMLQAKRFGRPILPIVLHACVHAVLTFAVLAFTVGDSNSRAVYAGTLIMLLTHTIIDIWKGRMNGWFPSLQNPANTFHWYVFGLDQLLHTLVIVWIWNITI